MGRRNKMTGVAEQFQYILARRVDAPEFWHRCHQPDQAGKPASLDREFKQEVTQMILEGTALEIEYARDTMPRGVLGMNAAMMEEYLHFIANRR
jgi:ribonucleoside-diphosphate reductase beta chain